MLTVIALFVLASSCNGTPLTAVWLSPIAPVAPLGQYQTHDGLAGSYHYAYTGPHHSKVETRLGGTIRGGYSYLDANGLLQTVAYTADGSNGFRVHASNLPQHHQQQQQQQQQLQEQSLEDKMVQEPMKLNEDRRDAKPNEEKKKEDELELDLKNRRSDNPFVLSKNQADKISKDIPKLTGIDSGQRFAFSSSPSQSAFDNILDKNDDIHQQKPVGVVNDEIFAKFQNSNENVPHYVYPVVPYRMMHSSLRHTQDSLGQYDYSYTGDTSSKTESRSIDGTTRGAYSYIDPNGIIQQVHYIADHNGFRVAATNLPEA